VTTVTVRVRASLTLPTYSCIVSFLLVFSCGGLVVSRIFL
jgi:hypothetical protein